MKHAIVSLSGGLDSTSVMSWFLNKGYRVTPVWFGYGSKHNSYEQKAVKAIHRFYSSRTPLLSPLIQMDLSRVFRSFSSNLLKSGGPIPEGHYSHRSMKSTVVPGRNGIFLSILAGLAESIKAEVVGLGIHQGDHAIYPDCRPTFFKAMELAVHFSTGGKVRFEAPFLNGDKSNIVSWGMRQGVPYHLTRTCYKDQPRACGKCGSCVERLEAFSKGGFVDKIEYEGNPRLGWNRITKTDR
jgi:7-cyano-7-deazaguanine synthase